MGIIDVQNLNKTYANKLVLNNLSLSLGSGQIVGLLGPNGCGKSTLIKILAGVISDYDGNVFIDGQTPGIYTKSIVSYLPEKTYLSKWMRPVDAVAYFSDFYADFDKVKAMDMIQQFRLDPMQPTKNMSKGMQEKLQLSLVMSRRSKVLILDEPLGGVDPATRSAILDMILRNYLEESILIMATHLVQDVERIFNYAILLGYGELILAGETDDIRREYGKSLDEILREVFACSISLYNMNLRLRGALFYFSILPPPYCRECPFCCKRLPTRFLWSPLPSLCSP